MSLLLALTQASLAQGLIAGDYALCLGQQVWNTVPAAQSVDVPVDVLPSVIFTDGGCPEDARFRLSLLEQGESGEQLIAEDIVESPVNALVPWAPLELSEELSADTDYVLRVEDLDGFSGMVEIGFSTGDGRVQGPAGEPQLLGVEHHWWRSRLQLQRELTVDYRAAADPDGLGVVLIRDADDPEQVFGASLALDEPMTLVRALSGDGHKDELCVEVEQLDGRGASAGASGPMCAEGERLGCSAAGSRGAGSLALMLGAMLASLRRRRS